MSKRRLFFADSMESFRFLTFDQRSSGDIYVSSSYFGDCSVLGIRLNASGLPEKTHVRDTPINHISFHKDGNSHLKTENTNLYLQRTKGHFLKSLEKKALGVRHLFSFFPSKPREKRTLVKNSDVDVRVDSIKPYIFIFWAVPLNKKIQITVGHKFEESDLETVPPESGFGAFNLRDHAIVWSAYRTKNMNRWPQAPQIVYHDGYYVPLLIPRMEGYASIEFKPPNMCFIDGNPRVLHISV